MARHPGAIAKPLDKLVVGGDHILREGRARDAATIQAWSTISLEEMTLIAAASLHLADDDGTCFVCVGPDGARIGVMTIVVPEIELVYFVGQARGRPIARELVTALIDHYFAASDEGAVLVAGEQLMGASRGVLDRFGFDAGPLDRRSWEVRRDALRLAAMKSSRP